MADKKKIEPMPSAPKAATSQLAQENPPKPKTGDPKATATPRVTKYSEDSPSIHYDCGE